MRRMCREGLRMGVVIAACVSLAGAPTFARAQAPKAPAPVTGSGTATESAPSATAPTEQPEKSGARASAGESAAQVGDRIHDTARSFGEALLDGVKYVKHTVTGFFTGDKSK